MGGVITLSNAILYESTATDFFNQGLGPLTEAKDPKVTEVGNGEFYLELDYPTTGRLFNRLKNGNLIKADAGHELKDQRFEIKRVVKSMKQGYVSVYAEHISNQALDISLPANVTLSGSAQNALQQAQNNGLGTFKPFTMSSDITTTNQTNLSIREFKNLKQALGGVEGSILDTWGGEYKFDNYHISLLKKRGRQANAMIAYGRNLVDLEQEENIMNTFTSVYPYAVWRDKDGAEHIIEGSVIHSEHADKYPHHKVLPADFTLEVEDDTKPTPAILNQLATAYIDNNDIGIPEVSIKLTHLDLSKTLDYKEYSEVEKLNVFDEVKIYFADFDINTTAKIVRTVWNVNLRRYDEIEVGKVRASLSDRINTIGKQISEARKEAQDARNVSMVAANGINMVFFGPDEPTATKIGDRWFMEDGQYTISKVWDGVIWRVVSDPRLSDQNAQLIGEQKDQIDDMKLDVDYSRDQLQQTIANSGFTDLDTAFGNVKTLSEQAESNADEAMQKAIDNASLIGGLDDSISSMSLEIDDINNSLTLKANTTDINRIDGTITDINNELTFQSGELSSKVSQTVYNADIDSIETTQTELTQTFEDFETIVIGPTGRLTLAEQFLDGFKNTAFDPESGQLSLTEQTIAGLQDTVSNPVNGLETRVTTLAGAYDLTVSKIATWTETYSVSTANPLPLKDINGNNLTPDKSYDIVLGVLVTGTVTYFSASLLSNNSSWTLEINEQDGTNSNHPYIFLNENGYPMVSLYDHASFYDVRATITEMGSRQKTSMSAMYDEISLRVQKDDLISQINIQADRTLIQTGKLLLDTETVVFGGDAFIPGAYIEDASIDSAKIGTLDGNFANIININASSITANDLSSISSSTGTLNVTNWINIISENYGIRGNFDMGDQIDGAFNPRWFTGDWYLGTRYMIFRSDVWNLKSNGSKNAYLGHAESFFGGNYFKLRTYTDDSKSTLSTRVDMTSASLQVTNNWNLDTGVILYSSGDIRTYRISVSDRAWISRIIGARLETTPNYYSFQINEYRNDLGSIVLSESGAWLNQDAKGGYAEVWAGKDSYNNQIFRAPVMRNTTTSASPNMYVSPSGIVQSSSSSARFKLNIRTAEESLDVGNKILNLPVRKWNDKFETETISEELSSGINNTEWPELRLKSYWGFIAEELEEKGLEQFVTRNLEGQLDGIQYAQMWIPLVPVIKDHKERIEALEAELKLLKGA